MTRTVALILFPGFQILDVTGPLAAFEIAGRFAPDAYRVTLLAAAGGAIVASAGIALQAGPLGGAGSFDTILVSGGDGSRKAMNDPELRDFLRRSAGQARRLGSICSGAYLLAAAGLLDGRRATTHWRRAPDLAARFPRVDVIADAIFVVDGPVWTSAGITAGIDLALAMIAEDLGEATARAVAQEMVVYYRRPGGQSQFSALLELDCGDDRYGELLGWIRENLTERLTVEALADRTGMSPRNFSRSFMRALGQSPAKVVERLRIEAARDLVESGVLPIERIAVQVGFHDPERMRRAFLRAFGHPPQAMRRLAQGQTSAGR
ncbi:MAG TPA: GlxA family transcriptional regulator [Novosphingobium sp.]|nr:GlxA family transcriptional regulator [Novosphingobium sp.]